MNILITDFIILNSYREKIDEFSNVELEKELAFELVKTNPSMFAQTPRFTPKDVPSSGLSAVLDRYKKN